MKHFSIIILTIFLSLPFTTIVKGQDLTQREVDVQNELKSRYGRKFGLEILNFNELNSSKYNDPYNTLEDCYIVMAKSKKSGLVAIYKNGQIIWSSEPIISGGTFTNFISSREVNNDGRVELFFGWWFGVNPKGAFIWILSWDGQNGELINSYDEDRKGASKIYAGGEVLFSPDIKADGVYEIMAYGRDSADGNEKIINTFKWNGLKYIPIDSKPEKGLELSTFTKNQLTIDVSVKIENRNKKTNYTYSIRNSSESQQMLNEFYLNSDYSNLSQKESRKGWGLISTRYGLINWETDNYSRTLKSGEVDSSFTFSAKGLPSIVKYYGQGYNDIPPITYLDATDREYIQDIRKNSVNGITLAPIDRPSPINEEVFTDSLRSYLDFSCGHGWVTNHGICNSLQAKMRHVAKQLGKGKTKQAVNGLEAFISEVQAQRGQHITEEGYAVLYYNAVYLKQQLQQQSGGNKGNGGKGHGHGNHGNNKHNNKHPNHHK